MNELNTTIIILLLPLLFFIILLLLLLIKTLFWHYTMAQVNAFAIITIALIGIVVSSLNLYAIGYIADILAIASTSIAFYCYIVVVVLAVINILLAKRNKPQKYYFKLFK